jgi:biopolymer transport protein ExbB
MKNILAIFIALAVAFPAAAENLADWQHKKKLVVDSTAKGVELKEGASQVPLALRLHTGNFPFTEARPDGADLRITASDEKTPVKFHVEKFDAANELAVLWVQVPKLAPDAKSDALVIYWGNAKAESVNDSKGTYDPAQKLILHFSETDAPKDATGYGNHPRESSAKLGALGPLGGAASLDGSGHILVPASPSLQLVGAAGFTVSAWIKPLDVQAGTLFQEVDGRKGITVGLAGGTLAASFDGKEVRAQTPLQPGIWQHVVVTGNGGKVTFYINGQTAGTADAIIGDAAGDVVIGAKYRGDLDEVTVANTARTADYIKALYGSQQPDAALLDFTDENAGGESTSYFTILLSAVTVDGWVIIGILMVMGVISFAVMIGKTRFLLMTQKANKVFLAQFKEKSENLLTPGTPESAEVASAEAKKHSPIYRLYAIGLEEMRHRFEAQNRAGQERALSAAALGSIRASMDAGMVRENQRINSQIVLLTIAISGGPFLGLLGTVVGVMITFAAIAAAGDVNVNSIAPGIAAALVATVAGLAVAIPALFGYNWLASQIKNVSADMQVFADEFLTKAAELHSR